MASLQATTPQSPPPLGHVEEYTPLDQEHPVFVTPDGRPRRRGRLIASSLALTLSAWLVAIVVGGSGFTSMPTLHLEPLGHRAQLASHADLKIAAERRERERDSRHLARAAARQPRSATT